MRWTPRSTSVAPACFAVGTQQGHAVEHAAALAGYIDGDDALAERLGDRAGQGREKDLVGRDAEPLGGAVELGRELFGIRRRQPHHIRGTGGVRGVVIDNMDRCCR